MPKAIETIARLFRPVPAVIKFLTGTDDYQVVPHRDPVIRRRRRDLNG